MAVDKIFKQNEQNSIKQETLEKERELIQMKNTL